MFKILTGDALTHLQQLPDNVINCVVTSPPYWGLRDYGVQGVGLEPTHVEYVEHLRDIFREVQRVLRPDGTLWLNLGDTYAGSWGAQSREPAGKHAPNVSVLSANQVKAAQSRKSTGSLSRTPGLKRKEMVGIPWRVAFALQSDGWYLRSEIIWAKPNTMPTSQLDRCTSAHETIFMLSKSAGYWSDFDAIKTPPRESTLVRTVQDLQSQAGSHRTPVIDKQRGHSRKHAGFNERWDAMEKREQQARPAMMRDVWFVSSGSGFKGKHFAVMPEEIARRCILAGCPPNGIILDPFGGAGTTALVALKYNRHCLLIELNPAYVELAQQRVKDLL